jgi:hypothetical protein
MAYIDQAALATNLSFISRIQVAIVKAAVDIMGEATDGQGQPTMSNHIKRAALAQKVLENPSRMAETMVWGVIANAAITDNSTDNDIQWIVNSIWDDYSGIG